MLERPKIFVNGCKITIAFQWNLLCVNNNNEVTLSQCYHLKIFIHGKKNDKAL